MDNMHVLIDHELKRKGHLTEIDTPGGNFPPGNCRLALFKYDAPKRS